MAKRHYIPVTADVPGVSDGQRAFLRRAIRTALAAEGVDFPCEVDVRLTNDETIRQINLDMREVDRPTDVLSFHAFDMVNANFTGRWEGLFSPDEGGTRIEFTEEVTPHNPLLRLAAGVYLRRQQRRYIADLRRSLEEKG